MITLYLCLATLAAGAAAAWRLTRASYVARLAVVEKARAEAAGARDIALSTVATRDRELSQACADAADLRERLRSLAGRDPVAAADDLEATLERMGRPR